MIEDDNDYPDVMGDFETGGFDNSRNFVLSLGLVKFNLKKRTVSPNFYYRAFTPQVNRCWNEGTREWWIQKLDVYQRMMAEAVDTKTALEEMIAWNDGRQATFWAMPSHFDFPFLRQLCADYQLEIPFHYRLVNDMNSFLRGKHFPEEFDPKPIWNSLGERNGDFHNALDDVLHQLKFLFKAMDVAEGKACL